MKTPFNLNSIDAQSSQAAHKAIQHRSHGAKVSAHRYERRKVRESLRQGGGQESGASGWNEA